jgi:hypothetical protein
VTERTALYRLSDGRGRLLYVGITCNLAQRFTAHARRGWWPLVAERRVEWFDSRDDAEFAEAVAIRSEDPLFNIAGRSGHTVIERREIATFWRAQDCAAWTLERASWTPTRTVDVRFEHAAFGPYGRVMMADSLEDAIEVSRRMAYSYARSYQRLLVAKALGQKEAQIYEWPKRLPWRPDPSAPEDIAA